MEQALAVLARLDRIDALALAGVPPAVVLDEVRALVGEAAAWVATEPAAARTAPVAAIERCRAALEGVVVMT